MPHKHTRKGEDKSTIDLPPSVVAKPLPVLRSAETNGVFTSKSAPSRNSRKRKRNTDKDDDTPRAFARLMAFKQGKKLPSGLDDGQKAKKKQKQGQSAKSAKPDADAVELQSVTDIPKIRPGERMSEFSARVDEAFPISGLINKTVKAGKDPLGLAVNRTKKEQKMHKMYAEWREQDRKIKEKKQEALELAEEEAFDDTVAIKWQVDMKAAEQRVRKKSKNKKKKVVGEIDDGDEDGDPWEAVKRARNESPRKFNDVVQAPPQFTKAPKEKFKVRGARVDIEDVPKASGSLRRREELGEVRRSVVEGYRQMMKENKAQNRQND